MFQFFGQEPTHLNRLFGAVAFVSALLLFLVQPMAGKMILPRFGGTPAVWNTCLVFFQALLLVGYAYTHLACSLLRAKQQVVLHVAVLLTPLIVLPIAFSDTAVPPTQTDPTGWLLMQLLLSVGLPFFAVATTSPLIQMWLHQTDLPGARDPYFLYSISNAGSLAALLGYPILVEPWLPLDQQSFWWSVLYVMLVFMIAGSALPVWRSSLRSATLDAKDESRDEQEIQAISGLRRAHWVALALVPSSLMMGVTTHITTDLAAVPLLWVLPLSIYLLTFIFTFARKPVIPHEWILRLFHVSILPLAFMVYARFFDREWVAIPVQLCGFFVIAMMCHGELARSRPNAKFLTEFYLWVSVGGLLGGCINALAAPVIFNSVIEYPLMLVAACMIAPPLGTAINQPRIVIGDLWWPCLVAVIAACLIALMDSVRLPSQIEIVIKIGIPATICLCFRKRPLRFAVGFAVILMASAYHASQRQGRQIFADRGFFGVNRVTIDSTNHFHQLINGRTVHGRQIFIPDPINEPLSYYHTSGPLGDIFRSFESSSPNRPLAVVGLGIGATACYVAPEQSVTFFEIDPSVRDIAQDEDLFTHLRDCGGEYEIVMGDARIQLSRVANDSFGMIVIDAFSSDSIPTHLITREAVEMYMSKLHDDGLLVLHISNKYLRLQPLLASLARELELTAISRRDGISDDPERVRGKSSSHYVVLARRESDLGALTKDPNWRSLRGESSVRIWTDDYSNLLSLFAW